VFLRAYTKTKDGKPHTYYALVESVRTDAGPRQRIVAYLGELNHDEQRRWHRTVVFHTREGFPLAHFTLAGNTQDVETVEKIVQTVEQRFGRACGVWVMDRGMVSKQKLKFLSRLGRRYVIALRRTEIVRFQKHLGATGWERLKDRPEVQVKPVQRGKVNYLLVRSQPRRQKERAMRRRQRRALADGLKRLAKRITTKRLKNRDKILERVGQLKGKYPKARPFVAITITRRTPVRLEWTWHRDKFKAALRCDGSYILRSNERWKAEEFWETYMQLTVVERAFRVLKSELLLRPVWHHYSGRTEAHVFVCVLAYALWKTLDHLLKQAGLMTEIHKPDPERPNASPKGRPMTPEVALRELSRLEIGDIQMETTDGRTLALSRVARPNAEQVRILSALQLQLPERLSPDRIL